MVLMVMMTVMVIVTFKHNVIKKKKWMMKVMNTVGREKVNSEWKQELNGN